MKHQVPSVQENKILNLIKLRLSLTAILLSLTIVSVSAKETVRMARASEVSVEATESAKVEALISRVNEIKAMDKSSLSSFEKQELRQELRALKVKVKQHEHSHGNTLYISAGALIIIIILLIVLI
jgi:Flp pilus assembly protein TadB